MVLRRRSRWSVRFAMLGLVVGVALAIAAVQPASATPTTWTREATARGPKVPGVKLLAVSCLGANFCMAVGGAEVGGRQDAPLSEMWNGKRWTYTTNSVGGDLLGVSCTSAKFCVAVGGYNFEIDYEVQIERWNGTRWTADPGQNPGLYNNLNGVSCVSPTFCMAVGSDQIASSTYTLIETWDGRSWSVRESEDPSSSQNVLNGVSCTIGETDCVAVGSSGAGATTRSLIEGFAPPGWSALPSPNSGTNDQLLGVSCVSSFCAAVGTSVNGSSVLSGLTETRSGPSWTLSNPAQGPLAAVSCATPTSCVGAGRYVTGSTDKTEIDSWNGSSWSLTPSPSPGASGDRLDGVSCTTTATCTAVGSYTATSTLVKALALAGT